jgi:hypothetical protein
VVAGEGVLLNFPAVLKMDVIPELHTAESGAGEVGSGGGEGSGAKQ